MNNNHWILKNGEPVKCEAMEWALWFEHNRDERIVKQETFGKIKVSTVFLGLDHNFSNTGPPILWETMVFGRPGPEEMDRCSGSREQAEAMHARMVEMVKSSMTLEEHLDYQNMEGKNEKSTD